MSDDEFIEFLRKQIEAEKKIIKNVHTALKEIENIPVKSALQGISLDSSKHIDMYESAISLLKGWNPPLDEMGLDEQRETIRKHVDMEEKLIGVLEERIPSIKNLKVSLLLKSVLSDERRHHILLKRLADVLVGGEAITEEDWWEAVWKDVPGLWT
jgi:rubrerythrin